MIEEMVAAAHRSHVDCLKSGGPSLNSVRERRAPISWRINILTSSEFLDKASVQEAAANRVQNEKSYQLSRGVLYIYITN